MTDGDRGPVLVTGATGNQGGAVARELLKRGWTVRAMCRDPGKDSARALESEGAQLVQGDLDERASLDSALDGAEAVFAVQNFWEAGAEGEVRQGKAIADAAQAAGTGHLVYSSVGGADRSSGVSHFETKWQIEEHIRSLGLRATVLRPVFLMENFNGPLYRGALGNGVLPLALSSDRQFQVIACADVGVFAATALERPDEFAGEGLEIAGEELTPSEVAAGFAAHLGRDIGHVKPPMEKLREMNPEVAEMFDWYENEGYEADLQALAKIHPKPIGLSEWIGSSWTGPAS